ncbi:MAG TPA: type IV pili methyl-accepting chemotaxis transducer N-terminal domain-containing protein [Polaromonas sp.]|uniref:type IV pili methyl-accepting chemotaxis transducer N-terminal domain-containing protein n=1 Tax=Polaromonas sp. TaxID=1869339 RepID=UPI002D4B625D|nr:type IV pili methyl-accepting chemotaxis transducer N-terminal domain-containing protein [Polaromonas sp.]HYW58445.1 type IV pili methyl-accepting chemotaxis transducer N-terminal domain-containing protein [Polaromonas sp.]
MQNTASLSKKLTRIGASLLGVALVSIGLTLWVTWQLEGGAAAVNEAGRMRMQTWRLASSVQAGVERRELQGLVTRFDESLALLREGDPSRPLFVPWDDQVRSRFNDVESLWRTQRPLWLAETAPAAQELLEAGGAFVDASDQLVLAIEQHLSRLTAILNLFQVLMMVLAIGGAAIMLFTGYMYVINPLAQLRQGLHKLESGDFKTRIDVETVDEFGQVAAGFNHMAVTLQSLYVGLEAKVEAKTKRIESQRARLEALYKVSAFLAQSGSIDELASGFAQRVRGLMKADAAAVRWSDDANQRYLMLASDCFPKELVEEERSLLAGACACGNLRADARTRVIPILSHDEAPVRHCAKVGYESVVTVPIRLQQRLLGEFNLFFRTTVLLSTDEIELLDALASHLASSLEGLRADALDREAAVAEERALLARNLHDSIAQSLAFLKIQVQLLRGAVQKGQAPQVQAALDELDVGLRESIGDVRELLVHFRTRTNTDDIEQALQETLQKFQSQTDLAAHLQVQGQGLPLPSDVQVQVLHVLQEALSNIRKHAGATQVDLEVHKGARWRFVVRDNGVGFDTGKHPGQSHVGLNIMRERAGRIGAVVEIVSSAGVGTTVTLTLPPHPEVGGGTVRTAGSAMAAAGMHGG